MANIWLNHEIEDLEYWFVPSENILHSRRLCGLSSSIYFSSNCSFEWETMQRGINKCLSDIVETV